MATIIRGRFRRRRRSRAVATVAARALLSATLALVARGAPAPLRDSLAASHLLPSAVVVVYWGDRYTLSVDGFLFGPLPADLLDEEDVPPNLVLLAPPLALYEDEDGA